VLEKTATRTGAAFANGERRGWPCGVSHQGRRRLIAEALRIRNASSDGQLGRAPPEVLEAISATSRAQSCGLAEADSAEGHQVGRSRALYVGTSPDPSTGVLG